MIVLSHHDGHSVAEDQSITSDSASQDTLQRYYIAYSPLFQQKQQKKNHAVV